MRVKELIERRFQEVHTITHDSTVEDAVILLTDHKTSALIVIEKGVPVGTFAEADLLRCYVMHRGKPFAEIKVVDAMTTKVNVAKPEDDIGAAISMMLQNEISHLPVAQDGEIVAVVSLRDLTLQQLDSLEAELQYLHNYINDLHNAARD